MKIYFVSAHLKFPYISSKSQKFLIFPPPLWWNGRISTHACHCPATRPAQRRPAGTPHPEWRRYWNPLYWIHPKIISRPFEEAPSNIEILSANHLLTVISAPANTGMPNTVVYLGRMEDKLLGIPRGFSWLGTGFRGQTTLDAAFKSF